MITEYGRILKNTETNFGKNKGIDLTKKLF